MRIQPDKDGFVTVGSKGQYKDIWAALNAGHQLFKLTENTHISFPAYSMSRNAEAPLPGETRASLKYPGLVEIVLTDQDPAVFAGLRVGMMYKTSNTVETAVTSVLIKYIDHENTSIHCQYAACPADPVATPIFGANYSLSGVIIPLDFSKPAGFKGISQDIEFSIANGIYWGATGTGDGYNRFLISGLYHDPNDKTVLVDESAGFGSIQVGDYVGFDIPNITRKSCITHRVVEVIGNDTIRLDKPIVTGMLSAYLYGASRVFAQPFHMNNLTFNSEKEFRTGDGNINFCNIQIRNVVIAAGSDEMFYDYDQRVTVLDRCVIKAGAMGFGYLGDLFEATNCVVEGDITGVETRTKFNSRGTFINCTVGPHQGNMGGYGTSQFINCRFTSDLYTLDGTNMVIKNINPTYEYSPGLSMPSMETVAVRSGDDLSSLTLTFADGSLVDVA